jgi:RNA polymerase sigma-70 factor, ECF subfamily
VISLGSASPQDVRDQLASVPEETDVEVAARFERDVIPLLDMLFGGAVRMTLQRADAEDLVQETLVRAYANFRTFQQGTNLKGWLFRIQANAHISGHRKRMRRPAELPFDTNSDWQPVAGADRSLGALRSAEVQVLELLPDEDIKNALDALPVEFRMTLYYADVVGLTYKEISAIMCAPLGTVMSRVHRGRSRLRVLLAALAADRGYGRVHHQAGGSDIGGFVGDKSARASTAQPVQTCDARRWRCVVKGTLSS